MINIDTLLSSFDERGTLLKWLKAVEKALNEATLTSVDVITISTQQIQLKFNFEDGTSITTPSITLPKGDKGDKGDTGASGQDGQNGQDGVSVTNVTVNASNHIIVTLSNSTQIDAGAINITVDSALSDTSENPVQNKVIYTALQSKMANPMTTAGDIIYGGASGDPASLPIGTAGQVLTVDNNTLKPVWANASGTKLYQHCIKFRSDGFYTIIINNSPTAMTTATSIISWLSSAGYSSINAYPAVYNESYLDTTANEYNLSFTHSIYGYSGALRRNTIYYQFTIDTNNKIVIARNGRWESVSMSSVTDTVTEL